MVGEDLYGQVSVFKFWTPVFEAANNGQEFFVVDVVVTLRWYHALVVECHRVKDSFLIVLGEDPTSHQV